MLPPEFTSIQNYLTRLRFDYKEHTFYPISTACRARPDQDDVSLQQQWLVNGRHYSRTLEDWLARQDAQRAQILPIMEVTKLCLGRTELHRD